MENFNGSSIALRPHTFFRAIFTVCCVLLAFDFRGQVSTGAYQVGAYFISFGLLLIGVLALYKKQSKYPSPKLQIFGWLLVAILLGTILTALGKGVDIGKYGVVIAPMYLMVVSFIFV